MSIHRVLFAALLGASAPLAAHHSIAMYDDDNRIELAGVVVRVEWSNPHAHVYLRDLHDEEWAVELDPPVLLEQHGWSPDIVRRGTRIEFIGAPAKSGAPRLRGLTAVLADGTQLRTWSSR